MPPASSRQNARQRSNGEPSQRPGGQLGRPTQAELEIRKKRILHEATRLFVDQGYAGTSFVEIAQAAGVAARTVYQHFGDKEMLFREVISAREINSFKVDLSVRPGETLHALLMRGARFACDAAMRERSARLMRLIIAESERFPALTKKITDRTTQVMLDLLSGMFANAADAKLILPSDHSVSARLFADLVLGFSPLQYYARWDTRQPTDDELTIKIDLFIRGRCSP